MNTFRERLNQLQIESGLNIKEFAEQIVGLSRQSVGYYLNGDRVPDCDTLRHICEKCSVSADWLLGISDVKKPSAKTQAVCSYLGITEKTAECLHEYSTGDYPTISRTVLNELVPDFDFLICAAHYFEAKKLYELSDIYRNANIPADEIEPVCRALIMDKLKEHREAYQHGKH